jgi:hypothetical protein
MITCQNCEYHFDSNFCPSCGQSAHIHPITVRHVSHDLVHAFTHADKGFLLTLKALLSRPGIVALEYINGKRKKYFNPISFLVITMAISAYLSYKSGYFESMGRKPKTEQSVMIDEKSSVHELAKKETSRIIVVEGKLLGLILITPLLALLSWIFFRKPQHGYAEHFVLHSYLFGLSNVARVVIFIPLHLMLPGKIQLVDMAFQFVFLTYMIIGSRQFFQRNIWMTILKCVIMLALFIFFFWLIIFGYAYLKVLIFQ